MPVIFFHQDPSWNHSDCALIRPAGRKIGN